MLKNIWKVCAGLLAAAQLAGCGSQLAAAAGTGDAISSAEPAEVLSKEQTPQEAGITYQVVTEVREDTLYADDGVQLAHYRYEIPVLQALRADGMQIETAENGTETAALAITDAFDRQFDDWTEDGTLRELAQEQYAQQPELFAQYGISYEDEWTYTAYTTDRLVSIDASNYSFYGGTHPNTVLMGWNFDLQEGTFLRPSAIAGDVGSFLETIQAELERQLPENAAELGYSENARGILKNWDSYAVSFDGTGMHVNFSPYELACYAAGAQYFLVDYGVLDPLLSEEGRALLGRSGV